MVQYSTLWCGISWYNVLLHTTEVQHGTGWCVRMQWLASIKDAVSRKLLDWLQPSSSDFPANCKVLKLSSSHDWADASKKTFGRLKLTEKGSIYFNFFSCRFCIVTNHDIIVIWWFCNWIMWLILEDPSWGGIHRTWGWCLANKEWIKIDGSASSPNGSSLRILRPHNDKKKSLPQKKKKFFLASC